MAGSKTHRGSDTWRLEVSLGTDFTGKRKRYTKTVHCSSARQADKELALFYAECEEGHIGASTPITVSALCDLYLNGYAKRHLKRNTQISIESHIRNWICPLLGKRKITSIKKFDINQFVDYLIDQGKSTKTIRNIFSDLNILFQYALIDLDIISTNPCTNVKLPELNKQEAKSYTLEELNEVMAALDSADIVLKCFVLLALFGGFRKGEILGLHWEDIDFEAQQITINRARYRDTSGNGIFEDTPKSKKSRRTITLPSFIFDELKRLEISQKEDKLRFGQHYENSAALLRSADGSALPPNTPYNRFKAFCCNNNLPFYGLHALRHTHASLLASIGADKVAISSRMGHSQISTTLNIYTHLFENKETQIADKLELFAKERID